MSEINIWRCAVSFDGVSASEKSYLGELPTTVPPVEWVWQEMDRVWDSLGMDNTKPLSSQPVAKFYSHPVWLMNGIFTSVDATSVGHRKAIASYISKLNIRKVADYGGGFGQLALEVADAMPEATITIVEPYPSAVGVNRVSHYPRIHFAQEPESNSYDLITAQDVLEHVENPVDLAYRLAESVRPGGCLVFANCFWPVIKCHLPATFHLRYTFKYVMRQMGLEFLGVIPGATHAQVFKRGEVLNLPAAKRAEYFSRLVGPCWNKVRSLLAVIKRKLVH